MLQIFGWHLGTIPEDNFNVAQILANAIRWGPNVSSMSQIDTNSSIIKIFRSKAYGRAAVLSCKKVIEKFETKMQQFVINQRSTFNYNSQEIDALLSTFCIIIKSDLEEVHKWLVSFVDASEWKSSNFWSYLQETADMAFKHRQKWQNFLMSNAIIEQFRQRRHLSTEEWIFRNNIIYDFEKMDEAIENRKERNSKNAEARCWSARAHSFEKELKLKNSKNSTNKGAKRDIYLKELNEQIMKYTNTDMKWDKDYCIFFNHPDANCKFKEKCNRKHLCPNCDAKHIYSKCPKFNIST